MFRALLGYSTVVWSQRSFKVILTIRNQSESHFCFTKQLCSSKQYESSSIVPDRIWTYLGTQKQAISWLQSGNGQYTDSIGPESDLSPSTLCSANPTSTTTDLIGILRVVRSTATTQCHHHHLAQAMMHGIKEKERWVILAMASPRHPHYNTIKLDKSSNGTLAGCKERHCPLPTLRYF